MANSLTAADVLSALESAAEMRNSRASGPEVFADPHEVAQVISRGGRKGDRTMNVLGIGGGFGHDPAAALVVAGQVVAACEEERFTRQKRAMRQVPEQAVQACLDVRPTFSLGDIDVVAIGWKPALAPSDTRLSSSVEALLSSNRSATDRVPP